MIEPDLFGAGVEAVVFTRCAAHPATANAGAQDALEAQRSCSWLLHIHVFADLMSAAVIRPGTDVEHTSACLRKGLLEAGEVARKAIDAQFAEPLIWPETAYLGVLKRLAAGLADSWKRQSEVPSIELGEIAGSAACLGLRGNASNVTAKGSWLVGLELVAAAFRLRALWRKDEPVNRRDVTLKLLQGAYEGAVRLLHTHLPLPAGQVHGDLIVIGFIHVAVSVMADVVFSLTPDQGAGTTGNAHTQRILDMCDARLRLLGTMGAEETDELIRAQWSDDAVKRLEMSLVATRPTLQIDLANPFGRLTTETKAAA